MMKLHGNWTGTLIKSSYALEEPVLASVSTGNDCSYGLDNLGHVWYLSQDNYSLDLNELFNLESTTFTKVATGVGGALMVDSNGKIWGHGYNYENQFGIVYDAPGKVTNKSIIEKCTIASGYGDYFDKPVCITTDTDHALNGIIITDVCLSKRTSTTYGIALDNAGKVYFWGEFKGYDVFYQAEEKRNNIRTESFVDKLATTSTEYVYDATCINTIENSPLADVTITKISAGSGGHMLFLDNSGKVWTFGLRESYLNGLGLDTYDTYTDMPVCISNVENHPFNTVTITDISAGGETSLFLDSDGNVWSCGYNYGDTQQVVELRPASYNNQSYIVKKLTTEATDYDSNIPICLSTITTNPFYGVKAKQIAAGVDHSLILDTTGKVWEFGYRDCVELTDYAYVPACITNETEFKAYGKTITYISAGNIASGMLDNENNCYLFGLGSEESPDEESPS